MGEFLHGGHVRFPLPGGGGGSMEPQKLRGGWENNSIDRHHSY